MNTQAIEQVIEELRVGVREAQARVDNGQAAIDALERVLGRKAGAQAMSIEVQPIAIEPEAAKAIVPSIVAAAVSSAISDASRRSTKSGRSGGGVDDERILAIIARRGALTATEIATEMGQRVDDVWRKVRRMVDEGRLTVGGDKKYRRAVAQPGN